ncbi:MAG TPA: four helix bundle protein [Bacteroidia bacterium]|nr:four helix bundle protein [Bacteroidia bacterium]
MTKEQLKNRTKQFSIDVIRFVRDLPQGREADVIGKQLLKSATSVAANYHAACRGKSKADFINKINIVEEEADESLFWLEIITETKMLLNDQNPMLLKEAGELTAIFTATGKTSKINNNK